MTQQQTLDLPIGDPVQAVGGAILSPCGLYRYSLWRRLQTLAVGGREVSVLWLMLNGSTADALKDDNTIKKCMGFTQLWRPTPHDEYEVPQSFRDMCAGNLCGLRTTYPRVLHHTIKTLGIEHAVGPENDRHLAELIRGATRIVLGWGTHGERKTLRDRVRAVMRLLISTINARPAGTPKPEVGCLGLNNGGSPKHPLMVGYAQPFVPFPYLTEDMFEAIT